MTKSNDKLKICQETSTHKLHRRKTESLEQQVQELLGRVEILEKEAALAKQFIMDRRAESAL